MTQQLLAHSRNLGKALNELLAVSSLLSDDVLSLMQAFHDDWSSQPLRRALVRASWAHIEGTIYALKRFVLRACDLGGVDLSVAEREFLSEVRLVVDDSGNAKLETKWPSTLTNIKKTLKLAASVFDLDWKPDLGQGWQSLATVLKIRHRVMHPKLAADLEVLDTEVEVYRDASAWFIKTFTEWQQSMHRRYGHSPA